MSVDGMEGFTIYKDFFKFIRNNKAADIGNALKAFTNMWLKNKEPNLNEDAQEIYDELLTYFSKSQARYKANSENGRKGGKANGKRNQSETKAKSKLTELELELVTELNTELDKESIEKVDEPLSTPTPGKKEKHKHGEFANVLLTDEEFEKLGEYTERDTYIEKLSSYIGSTGKVYKSHYITLLNWIRKDKESGEASDIGKFSDTTNDEWSAAWDNQMKKLKGMVNNE